MSKARKTSRLTKTVRSAEWWDFKFPPILGTIYATSILQQVPFNELLSYILFLIAALTPGASYVSILNDLTDLEDDRRAGKENRLEGKSKAFVLTLLSVCILAGVAVCLFLSARTFVLYLCAWIIFTLYSLPPIRLKKRGIFGVIADALGSHVFPQLFAVSAFSDWYAKEIDPFWLTAVAVWSVFLGLRGILWHQLKDKNNDRKSKVQTFALGHDEAFIRKIVRRLIFPAEFAAFFLLLWYAQNPLALALLIFYAVLEVLRHFLWEIDIVLVSPTKSYKLLMDEYYGVFYPIAFLMAGFGFQDFAWIIFLLHLILFFRRLYHLFIEIILLTKDALYALREFLLGY